MSNSSAQQETSSNTRHEPWRCENADELVIKLRAYRDERHVADHPFTQSIAKGEISREGIVSYLGQFCVYVEWGGKAWLTWLLGNDLVALGFKPGKYVLVEHLFGEFE